MKQQNLKHQRKITKGHSMTYFDKLKLSTTKKEVMKKKKKNV